MIWLPVLWVIPLLIIEAMFSGSEIALLSADERALRESNKSSAKLALSLLSTPEKILSTTLVMTSVCVVGITALMTLFLGKMGIHAEWITILITSPLIVIFGEMIPKRIFQKKRGYTCPSCQCLGEDCVSISFSNHEADFHLHQEGF